MKINAKRRRSKKQIEKDKQDAAIKEAEVANAQAKFEMQPLPCAPRVRSVVPGHLAAAVRAAGGVLRREDREVRVRAHGLVRLREVELPVVVQQAVQRLQHLGRRWRW